jgi:hypothetical protein
MMAIVHVVYISDVDTSYCGLTNFVEVNVAYSISDNYLDSIPPCTWDTNAYCKECMIKYRRELIIRELHKDLQKKRNQGLT